MPIEQRYTPVPGLGPSSSGHEMSQVNHARSDSYQGASFNENYLYSEGTVPAAHRFSYADSPSRPGSQVYTDAMPGPSRYDSSYSDSPFKDPLAAGAGAGAASVLASGPEMRERISAYDNVPSEAYWPESNSAPVDYAARDAKVKRNKLLKWGGIIFAILAVIAIVVGVVVSKVTKNDGGSGSKSSASSGNGALVGNDPAKFEKDPNLKQSMWGIAYTPQGAMLPACGMQLANVTKDIQLLSQLTTRIRLYGSNCNTTAMVLQAIQDTKVNMTIWPAIYINSDTSANQDQLTALTSALQTYGTDNVEGIIVGNEYILDQAGTASTSDAAYITAAQFILDHVQTVNKTIQGLNLPKALPVGTADAGSLMSVYLGEGIDFFMANVHPWFGDVGIDDAADWTWNFFQNFDVDVAANATNTPNCYIAETGWPTGTSNATEGNNGTPAPGGDASVANLQTFLDTYLCQATANGTEYFFFEAFDEPWKIIYGGVEPHWGIFDSDRNLKNVTIPTCS